MDPYRDKIANALRLSRKRMGHSQETMARLIGCTLGGYRQWEAGRAIPRGDWLLKAIAVIGDPQPFLRLFTPLTIRKDRTQKVYRNSSSKVPSDSK